jgi:Family of unknown function (DUF6011)
MLDLNCVDCGRPSHTYLCETCDSIRKLEMDPLLEREDIEEYPNQAELESSNIKRFILGGNATFTLHNTKKDTHLTYKVTVCKDNPELFFVSVLTGPDNWANYTPFATLRNGIFWNNKSSRISKDAPSVKAFEWFWENLHRLPQALKVLHEGKCGKCGRKLTEPESIESGFGPICRAAIGI